MRNLQQLAEALSAKYTDRELLGLVIVERFVAVSLWRIPKPQFAQGEYITWLVNFEDSPYTFDGDYHDDALRGYDSFVRRLARFKGVLLRRAV